MKPSLDKIGPLRTIDLGGVAVCVLLTAAVFVMGVQPVLEQREQAQLQREQLQTKQQRAQRWAAAAQQLNHRMAQLRQAVADHKLRLAQIDRLNHRLSRITELATEAGLRIERLQPGERVPGDHYHTVPIKVSGRGAFTASSTFLHRLHRTMPDVAVAGVRVKGRPDKAAADTPAAFAFDLLWYAAPPAEDESG